MSFTFDLLRLHLRETRQLKSEANKPLFLKFQVVGSTECSPVCFHLSIFCLGAWLSLNHDISIFLFREFMWVEMEVSWSLGCCLSDG